MEFLQTLELPHLTSHPVHIALFKDVGNASFLRQQLLEANPEFEYAFLDASMILSTTHILAAVFRAVNDMLHSRLKSKNVHSEIVFCLNPNNNIADAFRRLGIQQTTTSLLAIKVSQPSPSDPCFPLPTASSTAAFLTTHIVGTPILFTDANLASLSDLPKIKKLYKISSGASTSGAGGGKKAARREKVLQSVNRVDGGEGSAESGPTTPIPWPGSHGPEVDERREVEAVVLGLMALRGS